MRNTERIFIEIDPDLTDLIPGFLENRQKDLATMTEALDQGDFDSIRILGHRMKGAGGGYGFQGITDIGAALEQAAKYHDKEKVLLHIQQLQDYLERVEPRYV